MLIRLSLILLVCTASQAENRDKTYTVSTLDADRYTLKQDTRYILYDVNHGEGFNLRRDVYMRVANAVRILREREGVNAVLVLPPWGGLYHWKDRLTGIPWSEFFDVSSLNRFVPVIEFEEYLTVFAGRTIDRVIYLQHFSEGWEGEYVMKSDRRPCIDGDRYYQSDQNTQLWRGWFYGFSDVRAKDFECVSFQGDSDTFADLLKRNYTDQSIFVDRAETVLHSDYGSREYWRARRSMRYAPHLEHIADRYISETLKEDLQGEELPEDWTEEQPSRSSSGGSYVCAHWRRRDFVRAHAAELPSVAGAARQISDLAEQYNVQKVFLATDAPEEEIAELRSMIPFEMYTFRAEPDEPLIDGAAAIVEQIICARARAFTGSHVSTFSYRIQEDREIRGFPVETTFRRMCPDGKDTCEQPAKWKIVH